MNSRRLDHAVAYIMVITTLGMGAALANSTHLAGALCFFIAIFAGVASVFYTYLMAAVWLWMKEERKKNAWMKEIDRRSHPPTR